MQDVTKAILRVLEEGTPELRIAAAQILGEVRAADAAVVNSLAAQLQRGEQYLTRYVLEALAKINSKAAVRELVNRVGETGQEGDLVAHLLRSAGDEVAPMLCDVFDDADEPTQMRILDILRDQPSADAAAVMEKALNTPQLTVQAGDVLVAGMIDAIPAAKLRYFKERIKKASAEPDTPPEVQGQMLRILAHVDPKGARTVLVKSTEPGNPPGVRHAALAGLRGVALTPTQANAMLEYLTENDAQCVELTAELLVEHEKWNPAGVTRLRKFLSSRREPLRLFAIRAFRNVPNVEVVKTLIHHLLGEVPAMSEAASEALAHNPKATDALLRALSHEKDPARARKIVTPLIELGEGLTDAQCKGLLEKGVKHLVANDDLGDPFLGLLLAVRGAKGAAALVEKALRLRRARKVPEALQILAYLALHDQLDQEGRYQLALTRLLADGKPSLSDDGMTPGGDATMGYFAALVRESFPVFDRLRKESTVAPEALLRMGRHFAVAVGNERRFGTDLLQFVAEKHGKQRAGEEAKLALRAGGF